MSIKILAKYINKRIIGFVINNVSAFITTRTFWKEKPYIANPIASEDTRETLNKIKATLKQAKNLPEYILFLVYGLVATIFKVPDACSPLKLLVAKNITKTVINNDKICIA